MVTTRGQSRGQALLTGLAATTRKTTAKKPVAETTAKKTEKVRKPRDPVAARERHRAAYDRKVGRRNKLYFNQAKRYDAMYPNLAHIDNLSKGLIIRDQYALPAFSGPSRISSYKSPHTKRELKKKADAARLEKHYNFARATYKKQIPKVASSTTHKNLTRIGKRGYFEKGRIHLPHITPHGTLIYRRFRTLPKAISYAKKHMQDS